jgi:hypothetical protein
MRTPIQTAVSCLHYRAVPFVNTGRGSTVDEANLTGSAILFNDLAVSSQCVV